MTLLAAHRAADSSADEAERSSATRPATAASRTRVSENTLFDFIQAEAFSLRPLHTGVGQGGREGLRRQDGAQGTISNAGSWSSDTRV